MHQLAFGWAADGGVAGLPGDAIEIEGEECCVQAKPGGGDGGFTARMTAPNDDHVEDFGGGRATGHPSSIGNGLGRQVAETGELRLEQQFHGADRAVAALGHDHFSDAPIGCFRVVVLVAVDHQHQVGVLFD